MYRICLLLTTIPVVKAYGTWNHFRKWWFLCECSNRLLGVIGTEHMDGVSGFPLHSPTLPPKNTQKATEPTDTTRLTPPLEITRVVSF
jgi:hypothetical protein